MDAEVAVGGLEHALEIVEAERFVGGEGADDAEADALVNQAIEFGKFGGAERLRMLVMSAASRSFSRAFRGLFTRTADSGLAGLRWDGRGLATVPPGDEQSERRCGVRRSRRPETSCPRRRGRGRQVRRGA